MFARSRASGDGRVNVGPGTGGVPAIADAASIDGDQRHARGTRARRSRRGRHRHHAHDLRSALAWLNAQGDLIETDKEVDPDLEVTGLQKHMDGGCPVMFNNVKGKPNHRVITNLFGDMNVINKMFGWKNDAERVQQARRRAAQAAQAGGDLAGRGAVPGARHQEPKDVNKYLVPIRHTTYEPELTVGSGIRCVTGPEFDGGSDLGYNRMNFRWGNVGTFQISPGSHMWQVVNKYYKDDKPMPITMCFGVPPACTLMAGAGFDYAVLPMGCDEIGIAGAVQGTPIRLVKARTVDAMALADCRARARRLRQSARPPLRDQGVGGRRRPGPLPLPSGVGGLHGQGLQGADLPRHRRDHAQAGDEADHLRARRPHARRPQHRHHGARGRDLRAVRAAAARHRAERGDSRTA